MGVTGEKFPQDILLENLNSIWKQVPGSICSVGTLIFGGICGPLEMKRARKGCVSFEIVLGRMV